MLEQGKISSRQAMWLIVAFLHGSAILLIPSALVVEAKQDAWLAMGLATLAGLGVIAVYTTLAFKFPRQNFIQYSEIILGKFFGKFVGLIMIWFALHLGGLVVRNFGDFLTASVLPNTPMVIINAIILLLVVFAVRGGLEVFVRVNSLLFPFLILLLLIVTLLAVPRIDIDRLLPVMENGLKPVIAGSLSTVGFPFAETVLFTMIIPYVNRPEKAKRALLLGGLAGGLILLLVILRTLLVLGPAVTARFWFPVMEAVRMIDIFNFIQRIEAIIIINWIGFGFIKIAVCFYAFVLGLAQWLDLKDYKPLTMPAGVLMLSLSILVYDNYVQEAAFAAKIWFPYALPVTIIIPLIMLIAAKARGL